MKEKRACRISFLFLTVLFSCIFTLGSITVQAKKAKIPKSKFGATHHTQGTGEYKLDEKLTSDEGSASGNLVGFALFYERLFLDQFSAAIKAGYGLERSLEMTVGTTKLEISDRASFWAFEFRAFSTNNLRPGFKPYLGVGYGTYMVTSVIDIIPVLGITSQEKTSATIPFTMLLLGTDYTFGFGGVRLEFGQTTGKRIDMEGSETYFAYYNYAGSIVGISVYSFF